MGAAELRLSGIASEEVKISTLTPEKARRQDGAPSCFFLVDLGTFLFPALSFSLDERASDQRVRQTPRGCRHIMSRICAAQFAENCRGERREKPLPRWS